MTPDATSDFYEASDHVGARFTQIAGPASSFVLTLTGEAPRLSTPDGAESLRFDDVVTFLTVHHTRSISAAARQLQVTPSQVSKAVARMEAFVGAQLLTRSARGVSVSLAGLRAIPMLEEIARGVRHLRVNADAVPIVRLAAPSSIMAAAAKELARACEGYRFQCLELDPVRTRALAFEDVFDVAILAEDRGLGEVYAHEQIGETCSALFARPALAARLGPGPVPPARLVGVPFVMPALISDTRVVQGKDMCPMPFEERTQGHAAATFGAALELAASSDQVVFGPRLTALGWLDRGELVEVPVEGWDVRWAVWLDCHTTRMQARTMRAIRRALGRWLGTPEVSSRDVSLRDLSSADLSVRDLSATDLSVTDLSVTDLSSPELPLAPLSSPAPLADE